MARLVQNVKNVTILGAETEFIGELTFKDNLVITGSFNGSIISTGNVEVSKEAVCKVSSINANSVVISGKVKGDIIAHDFIEMKKGSNIEGDISTAKIRIEDGVNFHGKISMIENSENANLFSMTASEYKDSLVFHKYLDNN